MRPISLRSWTLVLSSALLQLLPFPLAGPVPLWRRYFCWFCLTPLIFVLTDKKQGLTLRQAAAIGYACGFFWYLGNCYWIYQTMHIYGHIPKPGAMGILVLFSLYLGLYHLLFAVVTRFVSLRFGRMAALLCVPFLWVATELARARITGFPWDLLGYTQIDSAALTVLAPITGVMGLSFTIGCVNVLWLSYSKSLRGTVAVAIAILVVAGASIRVSAGQYLSTATAILLQENLSVGSGDMQPESRDEMLASFGKLSLQPTMSSAIAGNSPGLLIWPESPAEFFDADPVFRASLGALAKQSHLPVIADSISAAPTDAQGVQHIYNTASFFSADGEHVGRYDKMHLVPFGEYTPYRELFFFAGHLLDNVGPFVPGTIRQLFVSRENRYGVFICYESIFGDEIREFAKLGADVLVNISDDGWYGDTSAPWEHLDMVRMRAIENSRWVLRATNTGITAAIDPAGRLVAQMPRRIRGSIAVPFAYRNELTLYTRFGDWFAWICAGVSAAALLVGFNKRRAVN